MFPGVSDSLNMAIRRFIPPPEHRPRHEIEAEVREEIEFHLALTAERIAEEERLDAESAKAEALKRFGNPETITRECTRIALKERIMLQRINTVLIALVAIGLIVVGIGTWRQQAQTTAAFEQINEKLTGMAATQPETPPAAAQPEPAQPTPIVHVEKYEGSGGDPVPLTEGMSVADALRAALGESSPVPVEQLRVNIIRWTDQNQEIVVLRNAPATTDYELRSWNTIVVTGTNTELPWVLYSPNNDDKATLETAASQMFTVGSEAVEEMTLQNIFERCAEALGLALEIDTEDLHESEHSLSRTVSKRFVETLTLAEAMDFACHVAVYVNFNQLLWDIHDGTLIVGPTPAIAERALVTSTYRVDKLLGPFPTPQDRQDLQEIVQAMVGFDSWRDNGGEFGIYTVIDDRISITTIPRFHRSIAAILHSLHDPQLRYPTASALDEGLRQILTVLHNTSIGQRLPDETPALEAISQALSRVNLPWFMADTELEQIGFDGSKPIGKGLPPVAKVANAVDDWLRVSSPDKFDLAKLMVHGGGIIISSKERLDSVTATHTYDLASLGLNVDRDTLESMVDLIQTRVDYSGWRDNGGSTGIIQSFGDLLVIQTTYDHHNSIAGLLNEYRSANAP